MKYAIIEASGKQLWVEKGKFYDFHYIPGKPGDLIKLKRILLIREENNIHIGKPCLNNITVTAAILRHLKGKKIVSLKGKPKKNNRKKKGHRQKLTRLLIKDIMS